MIKRIFIDTETTSVDRIHGWLWQIGGIIECGKREEEFLFECDIFEEDIIEENAMKRNNLSIEILAVKPDPVEILSKFQELLSKYVDKYDKADKFYFINFGAEFDSEVVRSWFIKSGNDYYGSWFWHPPIDIMPLVMKKIMGKRQELKNFKLETVLSYFNIEFDSSLQHNALYDARFAKKLFYIIDK